MGFASAMKVMPTDGARPALTFGKSGHMNDVSCTKNVGLIVVADVMVFRKFSNTKFTNNLWHHFSLFYVTGNALTELFCNFCTHLNSVIAVCLHCFVVQ